MMQFGLEKEGRCSSTKFKEHNGWRTHNNSNLLIISQMPNYFNNEMKLREKFSGNSPTTNNENVQDMERQIQRRAFQEQETEIQTPIL